MIRTRALLLYSLVLVLLAGIGVGGSWLGREALLNEQANGRLDIPSSQLDFGEGWAGTDLPWRLTLTNLNETTVEVEDIVASCNCVLVEPTTFAVRPGDNQEVSLVLNLSAGSLKDGADWRAPAPFEEIVVPVIRSGLARRVGWTIQGRVRRPFHVVPSPRSIYHTSVYATDYEPVTLRITLHDELALFVARCENSTADVTFRQTDSAGREFVVCVTPLPHMPVGPFSIPLVLEARDRGTPIRVRYTLSGEILHQVAVNPPLALFGTVRIGSSESVDLQLECRSGHGFHVTAIESTSDAVAGNVVTDSPGMCAVRATCQPSQLGHFEAELRIMLVDAQGRDMPALNVPVSFVGTGI